MNIVPSRNLFSTPDNPASHTYGGGEVTMPSLVNGRIKKNNFFSQFDSVGAFATPNEKIDSLVKSGLDRETFQVYGENVNAPPIRTTQARSPNQPYASITSPGHNSNNNNNNSSYIVSGSENSLSNISKPGGYQKKTLAESLSGSGASDREADTPCFLLMSEFRAYAADLFASDEAIMEAVAHACAASTLSILKAQRLASSLGLNVTFGVDTLHYSWNNRTRAIVEEKKGLINLKDAVPFLEGGFSLEHAFFNYNAYFPAFLLCGASHVWINSEDQIATPNDPNVRYTTYVLFAEDLFRALPDFPLAIYLTTGPDLRLVPSPLANVTDLSPASVSHLPPQFRSLPYQTIWSVITLQRFALFMYRWAQCPAGVIETLLLRKKPQETSVTPTGISDYSYVSSQKSRAVAPPPRPVETQIQHPYGIGRPPSLPKTASEQSTRTAIHKYYLMPETEKKRDEQEILDSNLSLPAYTVASVFRCGPETTQLCHDTTRLCGRGVPLVQGEYAGEQVAFFHDGAAGRAPSVAGGPTHLQCRGGRTTPQWKLLDEKCLRTEHSHSCPTEQFLVQLDRSTQTTRLA
ncbi:hypothetical protein AGDE_15519 [Angomonas deanei]|uniref:Uncharacterized protein n=1 Tax=Angomonas deanei TaxID=59799 RepID=A0A7G2C424_9TRYP|nr:hypothetical protein AGDE_15519 [Angomonas deanei]CAD2214275.1 hypothetical protein, conserved [Angomonas deanei]|eukprot:EPY18929.1 hypothetical protein AGDE_15519 [Angomonas deanei]